MVTDSKYAFDAPPPAPRLRMLDPIDDDALSDWIAEDAQLLLREQRPVELSRYLNACPNLRKYQVALDTAIEMTLQSMVQRGMGDLPACTSELTGQFPELADRIQIAAELSAAMNSTSLFRVIAQVVGPVAVPSDFGPPIGDGRSRYELLELLGQGSEGAVYRATDRLMSDPTRPAFVAVKMLNDRSAGSHRRLARHDEAVRARRVNHPNVVRAVDRGTWDQVPYAVFEYVEGKRLDTCFAPNRASPAEAARIVQQVAQGLQAIHSAGLIHCDLKPANVLVDSEGKARITDFGLAQYQPQAAAEGEYESAGDASHGYGTLAFVAPEQFRRLPGCLAPPADIYALGGLLYWLLTGVTPNGPTVEQARRNLARDDASPAPLPFPGAPIPEDLKDICRRALAKDPAARYPSAAMLAEDLQSFLSLRPLTWNRPTMGHRVRLLARREPLKLVLGTLAGIALLSTVAVITWSVNHSHLLKVQAALDSARQEAAILEANLMAQSSQAHVDYMQGSMASVLKQYQDPNSALSIQAFPILTILESAAGRHLIGDDDGELGRLRFQTADSMLAKSKALGPETSIEYLLWQVTKGFWLLQSDLNGEALDVLDSARRGLVAKVGEQDPIIPYIDSLRDCALAFSLTPEQMMTDVAGTNRLRNRIRDYMNGPAKIRKGDVATRVYWQAYFRLVQVEHGGSLKQFFRTKASLDAQMIKPKGPAQSRLP